MHLGFPESLFGKRMEAEAVKLVESTCLNEYYEYNVFLLLFCKNVIALDRGKDRGTVRGVPYLYTFTRRTLYFCSEIERYEQ